MNYTFDDVKGYIEFNKSRSEVGYSFPMMPKYNRVVGNIDSNQTTVVSGLPGAGVSSFIDQNYVMSVLLQWYDIDPDERPPLKILYFSMQETELKKIQQFLCNYLKLVNGLHTDIATLNNQAGKLYDLNTQKELLAAIDDSSVFFDEVFQSETLEIVEGQQKPTDIYNTVIDFMEKKGSINASGRFELDQENSGLITLVVIADTDYFLPDSEGHGTVSGDELDKKFQRQVKELKNMYNVSFVVSVPSKVGFVRSAKDTEPHYRHLGSYSSIADKGVCIYNPIEEKNVKFYDGEESNFITKKGNNLLRTWHVVRNSEGVSSVHDRLLFLPGTSYFIEHEDTKSNSISGLTDVLDVLDDKSPFYHEPYTDS